MNVRLRQADFVDRNNFADFLNRRGLIGSAAEIGVHRGEFSKIFLNNWKGREMFLVDPWYSIPGYEQQEACLADCDGDRNKDLEYCKKLLLQHKDRTIFMRVTSERAAKMAMMKDNSLDFVYIDGDHRMDMVWLDLHKWWKKLKPGGILAGHDFLCHDPDTIDSDIQAAVLQFASNNKLTIYLVTETLCQPWSFYMEKPK